MKVIYTGEIEVVCEGLVWKPGEEKDIPDELALLLVTTNANFVQAEEDSKNTAPVEVE